MSQTLAIDARNVTKSYGEGEIAQLVLKGCDLSVPAGEFMMLVGPSGSGKTTLLSILGCVLRANGGDIHLFGERISGVRESALPRLRLAYIGFIFQGHNLIASLTAEENVAFQLQMRGWSPRDASKEAQRLLDRVQLGGKYKRLPSELSGGERQRVAICRAVAGNPPIILADEPTASLDAVNGQLVTELLRELARERGHTVVCVTHDNRIFSLADRIVRIEDGLMLGDGAGSHAA
jgi:putative ABC transport system ATP-binding protein